MTNLDLAAKIRRGEIDLNNQSLFFSILIKGLMWKLRQDIKIRGNEVPHIILNTGDEIMYLEQKGYDHSKEPLEQSNEDYVYNIVPRCIVSPKGITLLPDQLTSPYANGRFQYEDGDNIVTFVSEFRRMPLNISVDLQYLTGSFTDSLELTQQIITKLSFIRTFNIVYMGQTIPCSYRIPESMDTEHNIEFDEADAGDRHHKLNLSIEVETIIPIFDNGTSIPSDLYIKNISFPLDVTQHSGESDTINI